MHGDRLAALDLGGARMRAVVELAVQLVGRLVGQHVQRIAFGRLGAQPFGVFRGCLAGSARKAASSTGSRLSPLASAMPAFQKSSNAGIVTPASADFTR